MLLKKKVKEKGADNKENSLDQGEEEDIVKVTEPDDESSDADDYI